MANTSRHKLLTPTAIEKLRKPDEGKRLRIMDSRITNFGVSVTENGTKTFFLVARFPGSSSGPARRELGKVANMSLADARDKAAKWNALIASGKDPAREEEREREAQIEKDAIAFGAVAEKFIAEKLSGERKGHDVELAIRKDLLPAWKSKPILDITDSDVETVIKEKKRSRWGTARSKKGKVYKRKIGGAVAARNLYALVARLFSWATGQAEYRKIGLKLSPCATINKKAVLGESSPSRDRALTNDEIVAFWRATGKLDAPFGEAYRVLMLAALRKLEVTKADRDEFDFDAGNWIIPAERMKGRNTGRKAARAHLVPLTPEIEELILRARQHGGAFVFSTTLGKRPSHLGAKVKAELDRIMLEELRALAIERGEDPNSVKWKRWTNHDLRRTVRSHLSQLRIEERVREAVLAHRPPGITGTYDVHEYQEQKRDALLMWAARLRSIVEPPPSNVVTLRRGETQ
jgi:hypothetical protein